jgi:hypothetical protein
MLNPYPDINLKINGVYLNFTSSLYLSGNNVDNCVLKFTESKYEDEWIMGANFL